MAGETVLGSPGVWSGSPSLAYQWQRCDAAGSGCVNTGSSGLSYVVSSGDVGRRCGWW